MYLSISSWFTVEGIFIKYLTLKFNPYFTKVEFFCETWVKYVTYLQMKGIKTHLLEFLIEMIFFQILDFVLFKGCWEQVIPRGFPHSTKFLYINILSFHITLSREFLELSIILSLPICKIQENSKIKFEKNDWKNLFQILEITFFSRPTTPEG